MIIPDWINPANWDQQTKAAARETVRVAIIFAITLYQASKTGQVPKDTAIRKIARR